MLTATFHRLLPGISANVEAGLWRSGVFSWEDYELRGPRQQSLFREHGSWQESFDRLRTALRSEDISYFAQTLHPREHYRIPLAFPSRTLFLDIETTGLSRYYDVITLVGWSYQGRYNVYIRGGDETPLRRALQDAGAIVTFNGSLFDLPFLRHSFPNLYLPPVHIDLRFFGRRVSLAGSQKDVEALIGYSRPKALQEMRGESAPILWHRYRRGSGDALKLLIEYNHCDIEGMKCIFDHAVAKLLRQVRVPKAIRARVPQFSISNRERRKTTSAESLQGIAIPLYKGTVGPRVTLAELNASFPRERLRVVGIDLTGSEQRPTGFCILEGDAAKTFTVSTDKEIVDSVLAARPHLVSIDSPLSLPEGRVSVFDDDPGREQFGIMRLSERILKQRGINVYPALIPSMQRLTARGIRLASILRSQGLATIESYPGAAQDIMGIPRKRASLDMLRDGLAEFGIRGDYETTSVSHDELDAITAAAVGVFFWSGRFEALGAGDEDALIVPDLSRDPGPWLSRRVIGLSGPPGVGKTTAARYFESLGFRYVRYSLVIEDLLRAEGRPVTRDALQAMGEQVHREYGQRWLGRRLVSNLANEQRIVVDGLRFPDDHAFLSETFGVGFVHLHLETADATRRARFSAREGSGASAAAAEAHPVESDIAKLGPLAHAKVQNESDVATFLARLSHFTSNE